MVVDPLTPRFEIVCTTLVGYRAQRSDPDLVVLRDIDETDITGFGMFVSEPNVTPLARNGTVAEAAQHLRDLASGKRLPNHPLPQELRRLVMLVEVVGLDIHLLSEKLIRGVDGFATAVFESEHFG